MSDLQLPKTMLFVRQSMLVKEGEDGQVIGEYPLVAVRSVELVHKTEFFGVVLVAGFTALAAIAKIYIPSAGWGWASSVLCAMLALLSTLAVRGEYLEIETDHGVVEYSVADSGEEAQGFAVTVNRLVRKE